MKKKLYILAVLSIAAISCNKDMLEFNPTDSGSGEELMKTRPPPSPRSTASTGQCGQPAGQPQATPTNASASPPIISPKRRWAMTSSSVPGKRMVLVRPRIQCQEPICIFRIQVIRRMVCQLQVDSQRQQRHSGQGDDGRQFS